VLSVRKHSERTVWTWVKIGIVAHATGRIKHRILIYSAGATGKRRALTIMTTIALYNSIPPSAKTPLLRKRITPKHEIPKSITIYTQI
jgi:predicted ribonuclease toxin of YeeF-YezG toxin-antitoxin module